ncbi:MAG: 4-hydroxyphenylpyruvate dioxygenase, partial [Phycisphaerales bacterium]
MSTEVSKPAINTAVEVQSNTDPLHLIDVDYVRLYVGNAKQAAFYYAYAFGFNVSQFDDLTT